MATRGPSPLRKHRYTKALPAAVTVAIPEEEERELRLCADDIHAAVATPAFNFALGGRALARLVRGGGAVSES